MRHLGRGFQLKDSLIHSEDTRAHLVKCGRELFARGDFFTAFPMIILPCKYLCWKPANISSDSAELVGDKCGMNNRAQDLLCVYLGHLYVRTCCKIEKSCVWQGAKRTWVSWVHTCGGVCYRCTACQNILEMFHAVTFWYQVLFFYCKQVFVGQLEINSRSLPGH